MLDELDAPSDNEVLRSNVAKDIKIWQITISTSTTTDPKNNNTIESIASDDELQFSLSEWRVYFWDSTNISAYYRINFQFYHLYIV